MLSARRSVQTLNEYHPPLAQRTGLRMDFNENTAGCSPRVLAALRAITADQVAIYPEREPAERLIAQHLALDASQVLLTNGVDEALHLIAETYLEPEDEVIISVPTFAMYEIYARATGARVIAIPAGEGFRFPVEAVLAAINPTTKMIAVANPNNPTGVVVTNRDLVRIAEAAPGAALVVDEAYHEFYGQTMLGELPRLPNLIVSRTFSKAFGMAGLRVGVIAARAEQTAMIRRVSSPYNVNAAALAALPVALADKEYVSLYIEQVRTGRMQLQELLRELEIEFWPSEANFVLARFGTAREAFVRGMRQRGVLVRDRNSDPGCGGCVRMSLGIDEHNQRLFAAVREVVGEIRVGPDVSSGQGLRSSAIAEVRK
jgi:histidinol-phosphate aminotransferase